MEGDGVKQWGGRNTMERVDSTPEVFWIGGSGIDVRNIISFSQQR